MQATDIIEPGSVVLDVDAKSKADLLKLLARKAGKALGLDASQIREALSRREALGSTGMGGAVAMPHAPIDNLTRPFGILARLRRPLPFDAIDEKPVDIVCLVLTPTQAAREHVNAMACVARRLRLRPVQDAIRRADRAEAMHAALADDVDQP